MATPTKKTATETKAKAAPKKAPAKKAAAPAAASGKTITLVQVGSPIGRTQDQRATLIGLGLNKMGRTSQIIDTASTRGMVNKVKHLVKVVEAK